MNTNLIVVGSVFKTREVHPKCKHYGAMSSECILFGVHEASESCAILKHLPLHSRIVELAVRELGCQGQSNEAS